MQVYHTRRMQRVFAVRFSGDASYVFSGSDDMNVRVWKVRITREFVLGCPLAFICIGRGMKPKLSQVLEPKCCSPCHA